MGIGTPLPPLGRSTRTGILALGLGITLALNGLIAFGLWQDRRVHIDQATSRLEGLAQVCETYTNRLLDSFDTLLLVLRDRLQAGANLDELHWLMKAQKARTPHLLVLLALDAQGRVRAVSEDGPVPDLSDRPYFTAHRGRNDAGLLIDLPRQSRYHDGQWFFALSRRLNDEQGRFAGVVVAAIDWAAVAGDYARLLEGGWDQVSLFHADGGAMLHVPMATDWSEGPILPAEAPPATAGSGAISIRAFPDGKERVTLDRNLSDFPLTLSVAEPLDAALEEWRGHVTIGVGVGGAMTLATFGLVLLLFRQTAAREDALRLLTQSEARTRAVFNQTFQLIALLDTEGRLLQANDQALAFAGIDETAVVGRFLWDTPWWIAAEEDSHGQLRHAVTGAAKGRFVRFEATHRSLDGRPVLFDVSVKPVRDETNGVVMILA
ncbi:MAG TPA: PAS domain-containing protein, partial [Azospirillaceae bacterium]|nr:PAS domain-containing protein [Azospirillaceae bacterium]